MIDKFLSCSGLGISPTQIIYGLLHSYSKLADGFPFADNDIIATHQGRSAIALVCQLLHIGAGDEILVPSYNCGTEIDPFVWVGANVIFYRIDNKAAIDTQDILCRVTPSTKLIYITHFFGWPQKISDLATWCEQRGLFLVEDCALSIFSKGPLHTIGRIGNAAIYSFAKSLPVPDGGALVLKDKGMWNDTIFLKPPPRSNIFRNSLPLLKKWVMNNNTLWQRCKFTRKLLNKSWLGKSIDNNCEIRPIAPNYYFDVQKIYWSISKLSKGILSNTNPDKIIEIRRRNYKYLYNVLHNIPSIKLLFDDLPDDVCPLSFPILVKDRSHWCKILNAKGILVGEWWAGYHRGFDWDNFPEARYLKDNLLTLPVDQSLKIHHMEHIAECVKMVAEENGNYYS